MVRGNPKYIAAFCGFIELEDLAKFKFSSEKN